MGSCFTKPNDLLGVGDGVTEIFFYHTNQERLFRVMRRLLQKSLAAGWKVLLLAGNESALAKMDSDLWISPKDDFLPHGVAGKPFASEQPILLSLQPTRLNGAEFLFMFDGAELAPAETDHWRRISLVFCGDRSDELDSARSLWSKMAKAGLYVQYWQEIGGRWSKVAEKNATAASV